MQSLYFWKSWINAYRYTWYALVFTFLASIIFFWFLNVRDVDNVIHWDKIQEQKVLETTVHSFRLGPLTLDVPAESYLIYEYFNGSGIEPNTTASYTFLVLLALSAVVLITFLTTLENFWFYGGMALVIFFFVGLRLEVVGLFGFYDKIPVATVVVLVVGPAFYFNRFRPSTPFLIRLLYFSVIAIALSVCVVFFSQEKFPAYHLTVTGYLPGLIIALLFIFMVAHEIFAGFIFIVNESSTKTLRHYSIISFIFFLYVLITALHELEVIKWNFIYLNAYVLLTISAILGIWGFRRREPVYGNIFSFYPFGSYFFLGMGIICFATLSLLAGNANDAAMRIMRHAIIFSQAGYGLIFMTYVISNFILMMARNISVYKVLYQPNRMPYFTYRFMGTIAMLAFAFVSGRKEYVNNGRAGFYNFTAAMYALQGESSYSQAFYEQSQKNGFINHHADYAMGTIHASQLEFNKAKEDYHSATVRFASKYALVNSGNLSIWENEPFAAIESYHEALKLLPKSGPIWNNLGFAYSKVRNLDSAIVYLNEARGESISKSSAEINFFALAASEYLPFKADSILTVFNTHDPAAEANAIALTTLFRKKFEAPVDPLKEKKLNIKSATLLNNYIIHHATKLDTTFTHKAWEIVSDEANEDYREALKASLAYAYYHQGNVSKALEILAEQVYLSQSHQGKFNYIMGLWALEQGNPEAASRSFSFANSFDYKLARFYNAIALTEARLVDEAVIAWDSVLKYDGENEKAIAGRMRNILTLPASQVSALNDGGRYQFCRYRIQLNDSVMFERVADGFVDANYKAQALLDIARRHYESGNIARAIRYYQRIAGLELTDSALYENVRHFELLMLASRKEVRSLANQINKGITFGPERFIEKILYTALIAESSGDTTKATSHYKILATYNPYFEEGILAAAEYYKKEGNDFQSYSILAEAIHVNNNSRRLLEAYIREAVRLGFDKYAVTAFEELRHLEGRE